MLNFIKQLFIAEFDGSEKTRSSFFFYQIIIIFSVFFLIGSIFAVESLLNLLGFDYCHTGKYCLDNEKYLGEKVEIVNNIILIMVLIFVFRFNSVNIERFSSFKYSGFIEKIFLIIFTILKLSIIGIIIFSIINFVLFFKGKYIFYINEIINFPENYLMFTFLIIIGLELFLFILGLILPNPKK